LENILHIAKKQVDKLKKEPKKEGIEFLTLEDVLKAIIRDIDEWKNISFSMIVTDKVVFELDDKPATIDEILTNPDKYSFEMMKFETTLREA